MGIFCSANLFWLALPLLLGLLTGWWAFRRAPQMAYAAPEPVRRDPAPQPYVAPKPAPAPVAAPVPAPAPVPVAAPVVAAAALTAIGIPAAIGAPDDLLQIKGVGPKLNELLISLGVRRFDQIAAWGRGEIEKVDAHLGSFKGRIDRDSWVEQAGLLHRGDVEAFTAKFGIIDSENQNR
jgi:predicted flap endonuclease-1-like 5' DNA nuclease